jgi:hypothetical protein
LGFWILMVFFGCIGRRSMGFSCSCKGTHLLWCLVLSVCLSVALLWERERMGYGYGCGGINIAQGVQVERPVCGRVGWMASWVGGN